MRRVLRFVHCTLKKKDFGSTNLDEIFAWLDASYAVNHDMRSQTGVAISVGFGVTHCRSSKKKLNTKISTESDLVGVKDYVPYNIWYIMFMHRQEYLNK